MLSFYCESEFRDLKRDVAKKLEKLERRTQRAIAELIRQYFLCFSVSSLNFRDAAQTTVAELSLNYEANCFVVSRLHRGLKPSGNINGVIPPLMNDPLSKNRHELAGENKTDLAHGFPHEITHLIYLPALRVQAAISLLMSAC